MSNDRIYQEILEERYRQIEKWGEQHHRHSEGVDSVSEYEFWSDMAERYRNLNDVKHTDSWDDILMEEIAEAFSEPDLAKRRAELIQCAAVIFAEIEDIDMPGQPFLSETFSQNLPPT